MSDGGNIDSATASAAPPGAAWRRAAALLLVVAAVGLPVNQVGSYALALVAAIVIFTSDVSARLVPWAVTVVLVIVLAVGQTLLAPPRIEEGHNVFLPKEALRAGLPSEVYRALLQDFNAQSPPQTRCRAPDCWSSLDVPRRAYAFSADGIFTHAQMSRAVTAIDFSDPIWLRLGFTNELAYNWNDAAGDLQRNRRDGRFWMGLHRWHLLMPWFVVYRFPAAYVDSTLCWRGSILWEGDDGHFAGLSSDTETCRTITAADVGRRIFGNAIKPDKLTMRLERPWRLWLQGLAQHALALLGVLAVIGLLTRGRMRRLVLPSILVALALLVVAIDDASFIGGMRPFDGGDDGLFYDSVGRDILQYLLAGDFMSVLKGGEKVFFYGGPGLRYFRAAEHLVFGETYLGYLSLVLLLVVAALALFRRFLSEPWALALILVFIAVPVGTLFGTSFLHYVKWASRGFADSAAYILLLCGLVPVVGSTAAGPGRRFAAACFGALLVAMGIFMKPIIAPGAAVLMGGTGLAALYQRQWPRLAGLCIGFSFVLVMGLHNWVFGHALVPFSANAEHPYVYVMPPSAYVAAAGELMTLHFAGKHVIRAVVQIGHWLSGPSELVAMIPLHAVAVAVLVFVAAWGRSFDPWLRLVAGSALAQHVVALFYVATARYHFLTWFLTMLVCAVWLREIGVPWLQRRFPQAWARAAQEPTAVRLASGLAWLQKVSA